MLSSLFRIDFDILARLLFITGSFSYRQLLKSYYWLQHLPWVWSAIRLMGSTIQLLSLVYFLGCWIPLPIYAISPSKASNFYRLSPLISFWYSDIWLKKLARAPTNQVVFLAGTVYGNDAPELFGAKQLCDYKGGNSTYWPKFKYFVELDINFRLGALKLGLSLTEPPADEPLLIKVEDLSAGAAEYLTIFMGVVMVFYFDWDILTI